MHFARFVPTMDGSIMMITVFDGAPEMADDEDSYIDSMKST